MLKETRRGGLAHEVSEKNKEIPRQHDLRCAWLLLTALTQLCSETTEQDWQKGALSLRNTGAEKALSSVEISTTEEELRLYTGTIANVSWEQDLTHQRLQLVKRFRWKDKTCAEKANEGGPCSKASPKKCFGRISHQGAQRPLQL